jgi:hypothetical protein
VAQTRNIIGVNQSSIHQQTYLLLVHKDVLVVVLVTNIHDDTNIATFFYQTAMQH